MMQQTRAIGSRPARSRQAVVVRAQEEGPSFLQGLFRPRGQDLASRIESGEFTDSGSTKEKITRPVRRALANDPTGLGKQSLVLSRACAG
jgi:beta-ring hydroxylase